jgi:hypothetical protein
MHPIIPRITPSMPSRCPLRPVTPNTLHLQGIETNTYRGEYRENREGKTCEIWLRK